MTQKEAIVRAIKQLGGRAQLSDIYPLAMEIGDFSRSQKPEATIRGCLLKSTKTFRHSPGKPAGWWELLSYQEEVAQLKTKVELLESENRRLRSVETADAFVERMMKATKDLFGAKPNDAKSVQQVLLVMNRNAEQRELQDWILGKPKKHAANKITVAGDFVAGNKSVNNEVVGVASGATGISVNKEKEQLR